MAQQRGWLGLISLLAILGLGDPAPFANAPQDPDSVAAMPEDVRRMHERLIALSEGEGEGEGSVSELRIQLMDGSRSSYLSINIESGTLVSKESKSPGAQMIYREGTVASPRVVQLLQQLIAKRYWTFAGTRFVVDAPMFFFSFSYGDLEHVVFRCDTKELQESQARVEIRDLFLNFVTETELKSVPAR